MNQSANDNDAGGGAIYWPACVHDALRARPAALAGAHLQLRCQCGYWGATTIGYMVSKFGEAKNIGDLIGRYRCRTCRGYPNLIAMSDRSLGWSDNIASVPGARVLILHSRAQVDRE